MFSPFTVIVFILAYVGCLFLVALWTEGKLTRGINPARSPWIYALSLAVYCTSWTFYGSVGIAATSGLVFLGVYIGPTLVLILGWVVLRKLIRIKSAYHIGSIADFISARYDKSKSLAQLTTLVAVIGITPYIALQLKAVLTTFSILTFTVGAEISWFTRHVDAIVVCLMIFFTIMFGVRRLDPTERHEGMVMALAVECLIKLVAFLAVGIYATYVLFDGFDDIFTRLADSPYRTLLHVGDKYPASYLSWANLIILSMAAILFLPRQFHIAVVENSSEKHLKTAMWMFPLYMLLINIFVFPIAAAGLLLGHPIANADTFVLTLPLSTGEPWMAALVFIGGFSAATGMIMVSTMTLSTMIGNHVILPLIHRIDRLSFLKQHLLQCRWAMVVVILLLGYVFEKGVGDSYMLVAMGLISFAAVLQFAPPILGGIFWRQGNRHGALMGLGAGFCIWFYTSLLPSFIKSGWLPKSLLEQGPWGISFLRPEQLFGLEGLSGLSHTIFWSLLFNIGLYMLGSFLFRQSPQEQALAQDFVEILDVAQIQAPRAHREGYIDLELKRSEAERILRQYLPPVKAGETLARCLSSAGIAGSNQITIQDLTEFHAELERCLAGIVGPAIAHETIKKETTYTEREFRDLSEVYGEILADLRVTPEELRNKIDFYRDREELLASHASELEKKIAELDREIGERQRAEQEIKALNLTLENRVSVRTSQLEAANTELAAAMQKTEAATRAKSDFLARMSHEIRTPMNAIIGLSNLILKTELSTIQRDHLSKVLESSHLLLRIINDILDFSKIEAGRMELENTDFMLHQLIEQVANMFRIKAAEKQLEIFYVIDRNLPLVLKGDALRLGQILINLISNAVKFTDRGEIIVKVEPTTGENTPAADSGRVGLTFSVKDTGTGIPKDKQEILFTPFTQVDGSVTRKYGGTGLGLSICQRLTKMMGGEIKIESKPEKGSTFRVTLSLERGDQRLLQTLRTPRDIQGYKILVVDDNETARQILLEILRSFDFRADAVSSGREGLTALESALPDDPFHLVLVDWKMPLMDGFELARSIQAHPLLGSGPTAPKIIMITMYDRDAFRREQERQGAKIDGYMLKPVSSSELFNTIMDVYGKQETRILRSEMGQKTLSLEGVSQIRGARILLAEDNEINQEVARAILEQIELQVDIASNGKEAIERLKAASAQGQAYDAVLMDIQMPVMDGYVATRIIRKDPVFNDLPIIAMTAHAMKGDREKCLESGMNDYVSKPIEESELLLALIRWIEPGSRETARTPGPPGPRPETKWVEIPEQIPGIDIRAGLELLHGNSGLYRSLLASFLDKFVRAGDAVSNLLGDNKREAARQLIHSIKGVSGNLGARALSHAAGKLEEQLSTENTDSPTEAVEEFALNLKLVVESLVALNLNSETAGTSYPKSEKMDIGKIGPLLNQMKSLLETNNSRVRHDMPELKALLRDPRFDEQLSRLGKAIYALDTDTALSIVSDIAGKLNIPLEESEQ